MELAVSSTPENAAQFVYYLQQNLLGNELFKLALIRLANHAALLNNKVIIDEQDLIRSISSVDDITVHHAVDSSEPFVIFGTSVYVGDDLVLSLMKDDFYMQFAALVNRVVGHLLDGVVHFAAAMLECQPEHMDQCLDELGITKFDLLLPLPYVFRPRIGSFVPLNWHSLIRQEVCLFDVPTLVALELDDPLEEMNPVAEHAKVNDVESSAVYIIVKIIERLTDDPDGSDSANDAFTAKYRIDAGEQGCRVASGLLLYAFPSQVVALVAGSLRKFMQDSVSHTLHAADCYAGVEFDSIVEKLNSVLNSAAQKLDVHEQRKLIKRLYLYWHSKQNTSSSSTLPARVLGALKRLIHTGQLTHSNNFDYAVDALDLTRLELRAAKLWENVLVASEDFVDAGTSSFYPRTKPNPQPREARRWMRQALLDMQAARNDFTSTDCHSPEWACFKCHQAVEKALKAMHYSIDCNRNLTHDLESLSQSLGNNRLHSKVSELSKLLVRSEAMRYPDCHNYPRIPHDVYSGRVETAVRLASEIVDCVERELGR